MRSLREQQKRFTYERLLGAALEVFAEDGYGAARVEDIAARAGASRATFYLHFRCKAEIITALMDTVEPQEDEIWAGLGELEARSRGELRGWFEGLTQLWESHSPYFRALEQALSYEPEVAARYRESRRRHIKLASLRSEPRAVLLVVQLERFCHLWLDCDPAVDPDTALDELAAVWAGS